MKTIFTIIIFSFSFFSFASNSFKPYKVIGIACLSGEHCNKITSGEFEGYWIKRNVDWNADDLGRHIRDNMFTKAVLDKEIKTLDTTMQGLTVKLTSLKQQCEQIDSGSVVSQVEPYKVVGISCTPGDSYCEPISSGPFKGYYMKSNVMPTSEDFNNIRSNMFTKATLNREKEKRLTEIKDLRSKVAALQKCTVPPTADGREGTDRGVAAQGIQGPDSTGIVH